MPVHLYGLPCDMDPIMALAEKYHLTVIEDAAQCFLGEYKGRLAGTIGHMASFSFENTKHMSTGDGGIVITNDERLAEAVRKFSCMGYSMITASSGQVRDQGICLPGPELQAARQPRLAIPLAGSVPPRLAWPSLRGWIEYVAKRQQIWALYAEAVKDCSYFKPQRTPPGYVNACWTFAARYEGEEGDRGVVARVCREVPRAERRRDLCRVVGGLSRTGHCRAAVLRQEGCPDPLPPATKARRNGEEVFARRPKPSSRN